jgi:sugar lactone lactonase YvrE
MRIPIGAVALGGAVAVAMLAGCSGLGQSSAVPNSQASLGSIRPSAAAPAAVLLGGDLFEDAKAASSLYVAQSIATSINDYAIPDPQNKPPTCEVGPVSFVGGVGVNALHDVYVTGGYTLSVFPPKCGPAISTVTIPDHNTSTDAAFNEKTKTAYVGTANSGTVYPIKYGATSFGKALNCSNFGGSFGVGVDREGNVYATGKQDFAGIIVEWPGGKRKCKTLAVTGLNTPIGIEFDSKDNLITVDTGSGLIDIFKPPYTGAATRTISSKGSFPQYGKLDSTGTNLYVGSQGDGNVDVYTYATGRYEYTITSGLNESGVLGVAVDPPCCP